MTHVNPAYTSRAYRGRNDDGTETTATWKAAENTAWTQVVATNFRVRFSLQETAGSANANERFDLQYNLNGGGWIAVTTASSVVRAVTSGNVADGTATTRQLSVGSGTFSAGEVTADGLGTTPTFEASGYTEHEYICQIVSADVAHNDSIQLRVVESAGDVMTQTQVASITVDKSVNATPTPAAIAVTSAAPAASARGHKTVEPAVITVTAAAPAASAVQSASCTPDTIVASATLPATDIMTTIEIVLLSSTIRMGAP